MNNLIPTTDELKSIEVMCKNANDSKFFTNHNGYAGIFSIAMYAKELGLPVMQCLFGGMHNIQGKIEVAPIMMNNMIRRAGHKILILKSDNTTCILKGVRKDTGEEYECSYTMADAASAGLSGKKNYKDYASDMLFARCLSRLARRLFADVIGSAYVEGEITAPEAESAPNQLSTTLMPEVTKMVEVETEAPRLNEEQCAQLDDLLGQIQDESYHEQLNKYVKNTLKSDDIYTIMPKDFNRVVKSLEKKIAQMKEPVDGETSVA
jgi:hypothetical protein